MKKLLYLCCFFMVAISACDPLEDVYEELDTQKGPFKKSLDLTLSTNDYSGTNKFYSSYEKALELIPGVLNRRYPQLETGSTVNVSYNLVETLPFTERTIYTLVSSDYALGGGRSDFSSLSQIQTFLNAKYPGEEEGRWVTLTYDWYNGSANPRTRTLTNDFYYINGTWVSNAYFVSPENYEAVGRNRFSNFVAADEEMLPVYFNRFLKEENPLAQAGDTYYVSYLYYDGSNTTQKVMEMVYDGSNWNGFNRFAPKVAVQKFKKDETGTWLPDVTISYTLVPADYTWISQQPELGTEPQRANLGDPRYLNFYQSWAGNNYYWSDADIYKALGGLLKYKFPDAEVGQKFEVTYAFYLSGNKTNTVTFELNEDGNYVLVTE